MQNPKGFVQGRDVYRCIKQSDGTDTHKLSFSTCKQSSFAFESLSSGNCFRETGQSWQWEFGSSAELSPGSELMFSGLSWADPTVELVQDNPCLTELLSSVLALADPSPGILSFTLQLAGILASSESRFQHLQVSWVPLTRVPAAVSVCSFCRHSP